MSDNRPQRDIAAGPGLRGSNLCRERPQPAGAEELANALRTRTTGGDGVRIDPASWHSLRLRVTEAKVEAWIGEEKVADLAREGRRLGRPTYYRHAKPFALCARGTTPAFRNIKLRRVAN